MLLNMTETRQILDCLKERGFSHSEIAELLSTDSSCISKWRNYKQQLGAHTSKGLSNLAKVVKSHTTAPGKLSLVDKSRAILHFYEFGE